MRHNQPVTQTEFELPQDATLMSATDAKGRIGYANDAFVSASGYSRHELEGQPHNIVRHPDMPAQAFADMWHTLQAGEPWTGIVKNRRHNGDHYWVRANAMPVMRKGVICGHMSVRTRATREEVAHASALYQAMQSTAASGIRLHKGLVLRAGLRGWLRRHLQTLPVRWRVHGALLGLNVAAMGGTGIVAALMPGLSLPAWAAMAGITAGASLLGAWWLQAQIVRPLVQVREHGLRVAAGAHDQALHMDRVDEIGMILRTIGQLGLTFRWVVDDVGQQVNMLQQATGEIAQGNSDLAARTEMAAASVDTTAASMDEISATVDTNAATATEARHLSVAASDVASQGGSAVSNIVTTMHEITDSSRRINDIIGVIDSIAFQTNILALNAAVEAARAGEQGRGFAVVAGEVRALAQRSASAAREIKDLIGTSVGKVESGSRLVDEAGKTMTDLVGQVQQVSALLNQISTATSEQSSGIAQVAQAISQLDDVTRQNAALVEQSAAASRSINEQTQRLASAVGVFGQGKAERFPAKT